MPSLTNELELDRCPHCRVDKPSLFSIWGGASTTTHDGKNERRWKVYRCSRCGGAVLASALKEGDATLEIYPKPVSVEEQIPDPAKSYLQQAIDSKHSPAGAVMLCSSAVDAMLKELDYKKGNIHERIDKAVEDKLLTPEMGKWAHKVRLDSNEPRHADEQKPLPTPQDAQRSIDFVSSLGKILFVIPSMVETGLKEADEVLASTDIEGT